MMKNRFFTMRCYSDCIIHSCTGGTTTFVCSLLCWMKLEDCTTHLQLTHAGESSIIITFRFGLPFAFVKDYFSPSGRLAVGRMALQARQKNCTHSFSLRKRSNSRRKTRAEKKRRQSQNAMIVLTILKLLLLPS